MKKRQILYLDTPLNPPGGGQISLFYILRSLKDKFDIKVLVPYKCEFLYWLRNEKINIEIVPLRNLFFKIRKEKPDIIHCNSATTKYSFFAVLSARILKIPFIWHNRTLDSAGWKEQLIAKLSTNVVVISDVVARKFGKFENKVVKIYNGVDIEVFKPIDVSDFKKELKIDKNKKVIGIISRLDWWKGHKLFLEAAKKISELRKDVLFLIAGEGPERENIEKLIRNFGLTSKVILLGFRSDMPRVINLCDVVINPSIKPEPFGRVIIESMACGKVVVATNLGGVKEIIDDGIDGFLIEPDSKIIANLIIKLLLDKNLYEKISLNAVKKVKEKFLLQRQIQGIESLYEKVFIK